LKILLADDSFDNRTLIDAFLKKTPYHLETAENGLEAVAKFKSGEFDLLLMDIQMPLLDGYGAVRQIREWETARRPCADPYRGADSIRAGRSGATRKGRRMYRARE
jgi:CheY-like chemotaxis protein